MKRICSEVNEAREFLYMHKTENKELRREVAELHRSLHQSQVESQALRDELRNTGNQSAHSMHSMDDKIRLLKEVERLKRSLLEAEEGRVKLLERAKRHQLIHDTNQKKVEKELRVLDDMIETVRKTLSSVPDVVKNCKELKTLVEYLG
ncbi:sperm-associated antigen 5-like [Coregonus clupeaformis]|uniref:sperm-associated antigen 5-like n=1 Tax=Coregonus clupeaformis TaxID=59861 RepID=UPI001E1C6C4B|nr:sperm-associated antigen 5-like [Coregonus clupeaformis]